MGKHDLTYAQQRKNWDLILVRVPSKDGQALREIADLAGVSIAQITRDAITLYLEEEIEHP